MDLKRDEMSAPNRTSMAGQKWPFRLGGDAPWLIPALTLLVVALIWGGVVRWAAHERALAEREAGVAAQNLSGVYGVQMLRALREIDLTLNVVRYASEQRGLKHALANLESDLLVPTALVFVIDVTDRRGEVVASNKEGNLKSPNAAKLPYFQYFSEHERLGDLLYVSPAFYDPKTRTSRMQFARRLLGADGSFAGVVSVSIDPSYFTSDYDASRLGVHGSLGIIGPAGNLVVARSGDQLTRADRSALGPLASVDSVADGVARLLLNPWDGVKRYTVMEHMRAFGITTVVGLSEEEQLEAFRQREKAYYWQAAVASALVIAMGLLWRQLAGSRARVRKAHESFEAELVRSNTELTSLNTKLTETHEQLVQSEKLASIGLLAAGVAHEINNPIGFVLSNIGTLDGYLKSLFEILDAYKDAEHLLSDPTVCAQLKTLQDRVELDYLKEDIPALMSETKDGIERVRKIVRDLKNFSHVDNSPDWQLANLHEGINSTLNVVNNEIKYKADVVKQYGDIPAVECLPSEINQVVMNLLVNAAHAIGSERGTITIRTGGESGQVWIEVVDTGCGISPENLAKVFDPFFTTKPVGKGTGLGLSLSYGIIKKHGGRMEVSSVQGQGTTFRVTLPVVRAENRPEEALPALDHA